MKELDEIKAAFLADDVDEETRADNLALLNDWEKGLMENRPFVEWQQHDITAAIIHKAKEAYKDFALVLATNRNLTDDQRRSLWAKQDAAEWLITLIGKDAKGEVEQIEREIRQALSATK